MISYISNIIRITIVLIVPFSVSVCFGNPNISVASNPESLDSIHTLTSETEFSASNHELARDTFSTDDFLHAVNRYSNNVALQDQFSCSDNLPESKEKFSALVDELYPVWEAVSNRDEPKLLNFLSSESPFVRETAWRGLANFTVSDVQTLFNLALDESLDIRWFTLSNQTLRAEELRSLEGLSAESNEKDLSGIYLVLGQKGDAVSHEFLISHAETTKSDDTDYDLGLAVGRSIIRNRDAAVPDMLLMKRAMSSSDSRAQAAWMYPWYRSSEIKPSPEALNLLGQWAQAYFNEAYGLVRQYMINILGKSVHPSLITLMLDQNLSELHPLEAVELARALNVYPSSEQISQLKMRLSTHSNPYVRIEMLQGVIRMQSQPSDGYKNEITSRLADGVSDPYEWLWHVRAVATWWPEDAIKILEQDNRNWIDSPHYTNDYLETLKTVYATDSFIKVLAEFSDFSDDAVLVPVIQQLSMVAMQSPDSTNVRLKAASILTKIAQHDGYRISLALHASNSALDWKKDQTDLNLLNHIQKGEELSNLKPELNVPDVNRIKELGSHPIWVLRTNVGEIVMRLDSYRTPSTVSTFAGLVNDGWYNGTPFHRVVHNFVVQGGAIWHPDYTNEVPFRVPTEGTELEFSRGAVGVASAGRDTETSQFFMMHMWAPHLNGLYSNIGRVIEGEDVIDRLTQGTIVLSSSMYGCY